MAGILKEQDMDQLEDWIGLGPKTFTLLYKITRDGCKAESFHQKCDDRGATVTVLYNQQGSVYGGYASQSWKSITSSANILLKDDKAFLYQLYFRGTKTTRTFPCKNVDHGLCSFNLYGPNFGTGDLHTFSNDVQYSDGYAALNGQMKIGSAYDNQGVDMNNINNGTMNVTELEVYKVADGQRIRTPWRKTPTWNEKVLDSLKKEIVSFKPIEQLKISHTRVLLIGPVGAGKSSYYNTINSVFKERLASRAGSGSLEESLTTSFIPYKIRSRSGVTLNFRLCDTRGLEEAHGIDVLELNYLLEGNVPNYYEFNPSSPIGPNTYRFVKNPSPGDRIQCGVFILDSSTLAVLPTKVVEKMKSFQKLMFKKGIPQAIILTKIDKLSSKVMSDVSTVFQCDLVKDHVDKAANMFGLPRGLVLPVKNYDSEVELEENISILAMLAMKKILNLTEDYMENLIDKMEDELQITEKPE